MRNLAGVPVADRRLESKTAGLKWEEAGHGGRPSDVTTGPAARYCCCADLDREREVTPKDWVRMLRPHQWLKNLFVLAPLLFSGRAGEPAARAPALVAFAAFCLLASGVYVFNDLADRENDRVHPVKRLRPIAAGRIAPPAALAAGLLLLVAALGLSVALRPLVLACTGTYVAVNLLYTWRLKDVVILDVFAIAAFFVLRLLAGSAAVSVRPSVWLLLCGGLLALYLGFAKRRHELVLLGEGSAEHRSVLTHYSPAFLDQMSAVLLAVTIVSYIMYTLTSDTAQKVGSEALSYSTPFVLYGVFRYLYLVHKHDRGSPTETVLTDWPLLADVGLWLAYCGWVIYRPF
jgi:4-hydroxybenzoate polyprenyltransferase